MFSGHPCLYKELSWHTCRFAINGYLLLIIKWVLILAKIQILYLRGPYNRGVLIIPRVRYVSGLGKGSAWCLSGPLRGVTTMMNWRHLPPHFFSSSCQLPNDQDQGRIQRSFVYFSKMLLHSGLPFQRTRQC